MIDETAGVLGRQSIASLYHFFFCSRNPLPNPSTHTHIEMLLKLHTLYSTQQHLQQQHRALFHVCTFSNSKYKLSVLKEAAVSSNQAGGGHNVAFDAFAN